MGDSSRVAAPTQAWATGGTVLCPDWSSTAEACNCSSPDTGNMEVLARFGTEEQKILSAYAITEPGVASSDASNIRTYIQREGDQYVINGRKHWITGAAASIARYHSLGLSDPNASSYWRQSQILVPTDTPGITLVRLMHTFGDDDRPKGHMEILFEDVRVLASNMLWAEGKGFEIAQLRLGPGRNHHGMHIFGQAERAPSLCASARRSAWPADTVP